MVFLIGHDNPSNVLSPSFTEDTVYKMLSDWWEIEKVEGEIDMIYP
jgi:hypothetical protein